MDKLTILTYIVWALIIIELVVSIVRACKDKANKNIIDKFLVVIPEIDKSLDEFTKIYKEAKTEDHMLELAVDYLYNIISENSQLDEKYPNIVNKKNVEKYVYPVFKKIYAMELKK